MIRRLQEIEPPPLALPSEKSSAAEDSTTQESLAAEFKKLLEKARKGATAGKDRDAATALGLALSQATSTISQSRQEVREVRDTDQDEVSAQRDSEDDTSQVSNDGVECRDQEVREVQVTVQQRNETSVVSDQATETAPQDTEEDQIDLGVQDQLIAPEDEIVINDVVQDELGDEVLVSQVAGQANQPVSQNLEVLDTPTQVQAQVLQNSGPVESGLQRVSLAGEVAQSDDAQIFDEEGESANVQVQTFERTRLDRKDWDFLSKPLKDPQPASDQGNLTDKIEVSVDNASQPDDYTDYQLKSQPNLTANASEGEKPANLLRRELSMWQSPQGSEASSPMKEQNAELSMNLTFLRHAFDALKSQTALSAEVKPRSVIAGPSGVGAAAEPKAAQSDNAPKAARYLNRASSQRMMERIESALKEAAKSRDGKTITLRLEPLQLGQVKCDVSLKDGLLHAKITPQSKEATQVIREHAHELQGALRRLGLNVDRVSVQVLNEREPSSFTQSSASFDGKSFQDGGNNMPGNGAQTPEKSFGNDLADMTEGMTGVVAKEAVLSHPDHWIA